MQLYQLIICFDWLASSLKQKKATKNLPKNLMVKMAAATTGATLGLTAISFEPAQAVTLHWDFQVKVTEGSLTNNTYVGSFHYDDANLSGVGTETLGIADGLKISFNWLGQTVTERYDIQFPTFPTVSFNDGNILTLNWIVGDFSSEFRFGRDQQRSRIGFTYSGEATGEGF
ncbi:MAG: hypothetical protein LDL41_01375, partial [Coleofasciculus sp. S288]|nr:hypothetical protein [Coleofasciculus sp. S288]